MPARNDSPLIAMDLLATWARKTVERWDDADEGCRKFMLELIRSQAEIATAVLERELVTVREPALAPYVMADGGIDWDTIVEEIRGAE